MKYQTKSITAHTLDVQQSHIDRGARCSSRRCPIALAAREAFPEFERIIVNHTRIEFYWPAADENPWAYVALLPAPVTDFINQFDDSPAGAAYVHPFSFDLTLREVHAEGLERGDILSDLYSQP